MINEERNYEAELKNCKETFERAMNAEGKEFDRIFEEVLNIQKKDGSFSLIDEYRIDTDCRVAYGYVPTYYGTAILMKADLKNHFGKGSKEYDAFERALDFSAGRKLMGAGYSATDGTIDAFHIFMKAGLFTWMNQTAFQDSAFVKCVYHHLKGMQKELDAGNCNHDWSHDFTKEFSEIMDEYYNSTESGERLIWYAAYGSNISKERFMKYINDCHINKAPEAVKPFRIPYELYFGGRTRTWGNGAKAFIDSEREGVTPGKAYLITMSQLNDIQRMEGPDYTKRMKVGEIDDVPVYIFTKDRRVEKRLPNEKYFDTILEGLCDTYPDFDRDFLLTYLLKRVLTQKEIKILDVMREAEHGLELCEIGDRTGTTLTEVRAIAGPMKRYMHLIRQDSRSVEAGHAWNDRHAVYFTEKKYRKAVDLVRMIG